jgi:hypothetical protein
MIEFIYHESTKRKLKLKLDPHLNKRIHVTKSKGAVILVQARTNSVHRSTVNSRSVCESYTHAENRTRAGSLEGCSATATPRVYQWKEHTRDAHLNGTGKSMQKDICSFLPIHAAWIPKNDVRRMCQERCEHGGDVGR